MDVCHQLHRWIQEDRAGTHSSRRVNKAHQLSSRLLEGFQDSIMVMIMLNMMIIIIVITTTIISKNTNLSQSWCCHIQAVNPQVGGPSVSKDESSA